VSEWVRIETVACMAYIECDPKVHPLGGTGSSEENLAEHVSKRHF